MSETAVLPDVAPFDAIANSRELLRPMIRKARRQEGGSLISLPLCLTWLAANNSSRGLTYWWYMLIGIAVGALGTAIAEVWRTHSVTQQQAAVQQAWSRAIRPLQPPDGTVAPGKTTPAWLLVALAVTGIIASIAVFAFVLVVLLSHSVDFTSGEWPLVFVLLLPLFGALAGRWAVRYLQTYTWTTFLWPGVLDPAMARELVETVRRADKVEFYAEVLQRRQSVTSDANG